MSIILLREYPPGRGLLGFSRESLQTMDSNGHDLAVLISVIFLLSNILFFLRRSRRRRTRLRFLQVFEAVYLHFRARRNAFGRRPKCVGIATTTELVPASFQRQDTRSLVERELQSMHILADVLRDSTLATEHTRCEMQFLCLSVLRDDCLMCLGLILSELPINLFVSSKWANVLRSRAFFLLWSLTSLLYLIFIQASAPLFFNLESRVFLKV